MENLSRELKSSGIYLLGNLIAKTLEKPAGLGLVLIRVCRVSVARSPQPKRFHWLELPSCPTRPNAPPRNIFFLHSRCTPGLQDLPRWEIVYACGHLTLNKLRFKISSSERSLIPSHLLSSRLSSLFPYPFVETRHVASFPIFATARISI